MTLHSTVLVIIPLQSLEMNVEEAVLEDGTVTKFRTLSFVFCKSKQKGTVHYPDKVFAKDDTPLHENIVLS